MLECLVPVPCLCPEPATWQEGFLSYAWHRRTMSTMKAPMCPFLDTQNPKGVSLFRRLLFLWSRKHTFVFECLFYFQVTKLEIMFNPTCLQLQWWYQYEAHGLWEVYGKQSALLFCALHLAIVVAWRRLWRISWCRQGVLHSSSGTS